MKKNTILIGGLIGVVILVGAGIYAYTTNQKAEPLEQQKPTGSEVRIDALRSFVDTMNKASGIESGAIFNYVSNDTGNATNFGIVRCVDEVRCDLVVRNEVAKFQQPNSPSPDLAEVDMKRSWVVSVHRAVPGYEIKGELPPAEIERIAREFLTTVYPEFLNIESSLTFSPGMKGTRLNNGNYFFRWNDEKYTVPEGLSMDLPPFIQVSITSGGFIFGYDNTVSLYRSVSPDEL
ncbi:MAG: hypothetical protein NUV98_03330 [Candidatus Roizmanbacteria bacterium]|nr:hypothetical protein [Candidatus Roizmanbacteria bacterium]